MEWLKWFGRWPEKERAYTRLGELKQQYGEQGSRVIKLSARTDLARKSAGSTQRALEFVENAFVTATQEYARIGGLFEGLEAGLTRGKVGDFGAVETALRGLGPKMDELDRNLSIWEARWQEVPRQIEQAEQQVAMVKAQAEAAAAHVGAPLPLSDRVAAMEQHLARVRAALAQGNPVEASHLLEDLQIALTKVGEQVTQYASGAGAITQAEQDVARARERLAASPNAPAEAVGATAAAEALLARLRPALAAGKLEQFQADLLQIQRHLANV